ncbi:MAG: ATP-binding protein [Candidatus Omnitrophota bacterium]
MNIFAISSLAVFLSSVLIALFVLWKSKKNAAECIFVFFCLSVGLWGIGGYFFSVPEGKTAVLWWQIAYTGVIPTSVLYLHFVTVFLGVKRPWLIRTGYLSASVFLIFDWFFRDFFMRDLYLVFGQFYWHNWFSDRSISFILFLAYFYSLPLYGFVLLARNLRGARGKTREQLKYLLAGSVIGWLGTAGDNLINFGIPLYPYSNFLIALYPVIWGYAILRHNLLQIEVVIRKTFVFSVLFISSLLVISCFVYAQSVFFEHSGLNIWVSLIPAVYIIVFICRPFENFLKRVTDKFLFQKRYDRRKLLASFSREVLSLIDTEEILRVSVRKLADMIKVYGAGILHNDLHGQPLLWIFYDGKDFIEHYVSQGPEMKTFFEWQKDFTVVTHNEAKKNIPAILSEMGPRLIIPLKCGNKTAGILALGAKKSDEDFTEDDIAILLPICKSLAIAIANAELIKKLTEANARAAQNEKMAVIGMLSAGINHEICNPLGIARGKCENFLSNTREGFYRDEDPEALIRKAEGILESIITETDRAAGITKRLSSFARPATSDDAQDVDINSEIESVLEFLSYDLDMGRVEIEKRVEDNIPRITADTKGIQEIFFNIIRNAIQSIDAEGRIVIHISRNGEGVSVNISDNGKGMSREIRGRIFNPFFTTKNREKGTGMGLFIVKQIIDRNNGSIKIRSEPGKGTEVRVVFQNDGNCLRPRR